MFFKYILPTLNSILRGSHHFFKLLINLFCGCSTTDINVKAPCYPTDVQRVIMKFSVVLGIHVKQPPLKTYFIALVSLYTFRHSPDVTHIQLYFIKHLFKSTAIVYVANGIIKGQGPIPK